MTQEEGKTPRKTRGGGFTTWGAVLRYIDDHRAKTGLSPTFREIGIALNVASTSTIANHVEYLVARGLLSRIDKSPRSMQATEKGRIILDRRQPDESARGTDNLDRHDGTSPQG